MASDPIEELTWHELEVLRLLDAKLSDEAIAEVLHLSPEALQSYKSRIYRKLRLLPRNLRLLPPRLPEHDAPGES